MADNEQLYLLLFHASSIVFVISIVNNMLIYL